jgi:hypothetical protein
MNVGFCRWVRRRGLKGDTVELMAHEAYLGFREGSWKHDVAATVHRLMVSLLLSVSRRVWVSIPAWVSACGRTRSAAGSSSAGSRCRAPFQS